MMAVWPPLRKRTGEDEEARHVRQRVGGGGCQAAAPPLRHSADPMAVENCVQVASPFTLRRAFPAAFFYCSRCNRTLPARCPLARRSDACAEHPGAFREYVHGQTGCDMPSERIRMWECCGLTDPKAPGCVPRPHMPQHERSSSASVAQLGVWHA